MNAERSPHIHPDENVAYANTDRELWHEGDPQDGMSYFGGTVYVKTLREWHALAGGPFSLTSQFYPDHPERGWHEATPLPEPRIWRFWRWLGLMR